MHFQFLNCNYLARKLLDQVHSGSVEWSHYIKHQSFCERNWFFEKNPNKYLFYTKLKLNLKLLQMSWANGCYVIQCWNIISTATWQLTFFNIHIFNTQLKIVRHFLYHKTVRVVFKLEILTLVNLISCAMCHVTSDQFIGRENWAYF